MQSDNDKMSLENTEEAGQQKRLNIRRKTGIDPKVMSTLERIRLAILTIVLIGLGIYAYRYHQRQNDVRAVYKLLEVEDATTAIEKIRELEMKWGRSGESSFLRGRSHRYLGEVELSNRALVQAQAEGYNAERLQHEQLLLDVEFIKPEISEADAREIVASYQADIDENGTALVRGLLRVNNIANAYMILTLWNHEHPDSYRLKYLTGLVFERLNEYVKAKELYEAAYELNPTYIPLWLELANAYWLDSAPDKAYEFFDKYFQKRPNDPLAEGGRIEALVALGEFEKVDQYFASYKEPLDVNARARIFRAQAYQGLEKYPEVIETLEPLIKVWPKDIAANEMLAVAYQEVGRTEEASKCASAFRDGNQQISGLSAKREAIAKDFENAALHYELGHILLHYLSRPEGFAELQMALQFDPNFIAAYEDLIYYYKATGDVIEAQAHERKLFELKRDNG